MKNNNLPEKPGKKLSANAAKTIISLLLCFGAAFLIYVLILKYEFALGYHLLYIVTGVLCCVVVVLNGGFSKSVPSPEQLRDDWDDEKKQKFISRIEKGKAIAKKLMIVLVPLLAVIMIDIISLFWTKS